MFLLKTLTAGMMYQYVINVKMKQKTQPNLKNKYIAMERQLFYLYKKIYVLKRVAPTPPGAADPTPPPWRSWQTGHLPERTSGERLAPSQSSDLQRYACGKLLRQSADMCGGSSPGKLLIPLAQSPGSQHPHSSKYVSRNIIVLFVSLFNLITIEVWSQIGQSQGKASENELSRRLPGQALRPLTDEATRNFQTSCSVSLVVKVMCSPVGETSKY